MIHLAAGGAVAPPDRSAEPPKLLPVAFGGVWEFTDTGPHPGPVIVLPLGVRDGA